MLRCLIIFFSFSVYSIINIRRWIKWIIVCMLRCFIISFLLLCLLYHQHQMVSKTELLCACYGVLLFLFSFSVYSIINIRLWVKLNYCEHVTVFDFFSFSVYSIINIRRWENELLCACYGVWLFLFSFSVYSINNIRGWVKLNYCVHVTVFYYFFSPSLSTLSSTSDGE